MSKKYQFAIFFLFIWMIFSCAKEVSHPSSISLERWTVSGNKDEQRKDAIQYLETVQYGDAGEETAKLFYDQNKNLAAKEIRIFKDGTIIPKGSQYKDAQDSLLSYYVFQTDESNRVITSKAFDASNDELLRIEKFDHDKNGNIIEKTILNASGLPVRIMKYTYDAKGNEMQVQVLQPDGTEILTEVFNITKYNDKGLWTEKWGFVKEEPFSYVSRRITY